MNGPTRKNMCGIFVIFAEIFPGLSLFCELWKFWVWVAVYAYEYVGFASAENKIFAKTYNSGNALRGFPTNTKWLAFICLIRCRILVGFNTRILVSVLYVHKPIDTEAFSHMPSRRSFGSQKCALHFERCRKWKHSCTYVMDVIYTRKKQQDRENVGERNMHAWTK